MDFFFKYFASFFVCLSFSVLPIVAAQSSKVDMVIYSYNRPMQLYALLESTQLHITGLGDVQVIYRADKEYDPAYEQVKSDFSDIIFLKQGSNPDKDFKPLTLSATFGSSNNHVLFAVDDIVIKDDVDLSFCIDQMEKSKAYGFYLRLGKAISYCYNTNSSQALPPLKKLSEGVYEWEIDQGQLDWGYLNTLDMTVYRKKDIQDPISHSKFTNPTSFEANWKKEKNELKGLCFEESKIVNIPANRVQNSEPNRSMNGDTSALLKLFNEGYKIDIASFTKMKNNSPHTEVDYKFIKRDVLNSDVRSIVKVERFGLPVEGLSIAARYLPEDPIIIEAGAYEGTDSVIVAKQWPKGTLYSFEPIPDLYKRLVHSAKACKNIHTYSCAVGEVVGEAKMYVSEYQNEPGVSTQSSSLLEPKEHLKYSDVKFPKCITVPVTTFDAWSKENHVDHVDLLWLDMQGYELNALKASPILLKTVKVILTEVEHIEAYSGQSMYADVKKWLEEQGFVLVARNYYVDWFEDALFVRKELINGKNK